MYRTVILLYWPHVSGFILCWPFGQYLYLFLLLLFCFTFDFIMLADKFSNDKFSNNPVFSWQNVIKDPKHTLWSIGVPTLCDDYVIVLT